MEAKFHSFHLLLVMGEMSELLFGATSRTQPLVYFWRSGRFESVWQKSAATKKKSFGIRPVA